MGKYKVYSLKYKAAAIDYLKHHTISDTAKVFNVDRKRIHEWRDNEENIKEQLQSGNTDRKRVAGGGAKKRSEELEERLRNRILQHRERRMHVSRRRVQLWAKEMTNHPEFKASNGWLDKFLKRNGFSQRKRTTVAQQTPKECIQKLVSYICYLGDVRKRGKYIDDTMSWMNYLFGWSQFLKLLSI